jgi:hypothetical protein
MKLSFAIYAVLLVALVTAWTKLVHSHRGDTSRDTKRARGLAGPNARLDSRNTDGAASAPAFYPPLRLLTSDVLCGRCWNPAHQVGVLDRAGLCRTCAPIVASFQGHQRGSLDIAVRVLPFERRHA